MSQAFYLVQKILTEKIQQIKFLKEAKIYLEKALFNKFNIEII